MKNKRLQLVTFEQAKRFKKAGFLWQTEEYFTKASWSRDVHEHSQTLKSYDRYLNASRDWLKCDDLYLRPTVALALKWMRDEKGMLFDVLYVRHNYSPTKVHGWRGEYRIDNKTGATTLDFETYEAAESALLDELLTIIENNE